MTVHWGIDLGISNTTVCEDRSGRPRIVNVPGLVKLEPLTRTPVVPSCLTILGCPAADALRAGFVVAAPNRAPTGDADGLPEAAGPNAPGWWPR